MLSSHYAQAVEGGPCWAHEMFSFAFRLDNGGFHLFHNTNRNAEQRIVQQSQSQLERDGDRSRTCSPR